MNDIELRKENLPANIEDLAKFVKRGQIGRSVRQSMINEAAKKGDWGFVAELRSEAQDFAEDLLDAEVRLGQMFSEIPKAVNQHDKRALPTGGQSTKETTLEELGFTHASAQRLETLARNIDLVEVAKAQALKDEILVTRSAVLKLVKTQKKTVQIQERKEEYQAAHQADIPEEERPIVYHAHYSNFLNTINDRSIDLLFTDPPYLTDVEDIYEFASDWLLMALSKVKDSGRAFICIGAYPEEVHAYLTVLLNQSRFLIDNPLIWTYKNTLGVTPKMKYNLNYQMILHLYTEESNPLDTSVTNEMFSVQEINAPDGRIGNRLHTWQKPDELALRLIKHSTQPGDTILDCFACTGTFLLAGVKLGRYAVGCDIDEENLKIANQRGCIIQ